MKIKDLNLSDKKSFIYRLGKKINDNLCEENEF